MTTPTVETLISHVRALAKKNPLAVYNSPQSGVSGRQCFYTRGDAAGEPGCLLGQALVRAGISRARLEKLDTHPRTISLVLYDLGLRGTRSQERWLHEVQVSQDVKNSWKKAVADADHRCGLTPQEN